MKIRLALSLAWASLWHRRRVLTLATLTLTLSVTLLLGVQYLRTEVRQSFTNTISGTDLIVGARSGQLNLLLYTGASEKAAPPWGRSLASGSVPSSSRSQRVHGSPRARRPRRRAHFRPKPRRAHP